ncbi:GGDEF domain-containing protein [Sphingomonas panaciterrae]|uniref:GGDEF domain-containing protein n=1 Tax=Sphingomonas panaciterrae TaxID=1462999 RepID=UPI002FF37467
MALAGSAWGRKRTSTVKVSTAETEAFSLYEAIGAFLAIHRLSADPAYYALAHEILSHPDGALARAVAVRTDGGVRLTQQDMAELGVLARTQPHDTPARPAEDALVAQLTMQLGDFSETVRSIHAETSDFGRDLIATAAAMRQADPASTRNYISELTAAMIERVRQAEARLAAAEQESEALRSALADARSDARQDPLTELANRRAFDEALSALPPHTPVIFALCDIDHFKRVNDQFGHAVGDRVLRAVGQTIAAESGSALVARYGGEEFALLLVGVDMDTATGIVDRARSAVAARRFRSRATDAPIGVVTISAGLAAGTAGETREVLCARADAALYQAKAAGRNQVLSAV